MDSLAFSPDGTLVATGWNSLGNMTARVFEARTGQEVARLALGELVLNLGFVSFYKDMPATIHVIANAGAMLTLGQERSKEDTALTVEPRFSGDSKAPPSTRATELSDVTLWLA